MSLEKKQSTIYTEHTHSEFSNTSNEIYYKECIDYCRIDIQEDTHKSSHLLVIQKAVDKYMCYFLIQN